MYILENYQLGSEARCQTLAYSDEKKIVAHVKGQLSKGEKKNLHYITYANNSSQVMLSKEKLKPASLELSGTMKDAVVLVELPDQGYWLCIFKEGAVVSLSDIVTDSLDNVVFILSTALEESPGLNETATFYASNSFLGEEDDVSDFNELLESSGIDPETFLPNRETFDYEQLKNLLVASSLVKSKEITRVSLNKTFLTLPVLAVAGLIFIFVLDDDTPEIDPNVTWDAPKEVSLSEKLKGNQLASLKNNYHELYEEEVNWLRARLSVSAVKPQLDVFLRAYEDIPLSMAGWDLGRIRYIVDEERLGQSSGDNSVHVETLWSRSELGTPRSLQSSIPEGSRLSLSENWNEGLVWIQYELDYGAALDDSIDIETYLESNASTIVDLVSDLQASGLTYVIGKVETPRRFKPALWGADAGAALDPNAPIVQYNAITFELQGVGIESMFNAFTLANGFKTALPTKLVISASEGSAWSLTFNMILGLKSIDSMQTLENKIHESNS